LLSVVAAAFIAVRAIIPPCIARHDLDRDLDRQTRLVTQQLEDAKEELRFEYAAKLRDEIKDLRRELMALAEA